jgi:hypothetical protein
MVVGKSTRRLPLRDLLTHAEKASRDLGEQLRATLWPRLSEFRDLSRPVRRHSHYPTLVAVQNGLQKLQEAAEETNNLGEQLCDQLEDIRERARRERVSRI